MRKLSTDLIKSGSFTGSFSGSFVGLINSASYSQTASFSLNTFSLTTGSTYSITSSWSNNSVSSSFSRNSISSSYSNTASNLSPVTQDLIPITGSTYSLGSVTNKWKDLYVSTGSIYIGDTVLTTSGSTLYANVQPIVTLNTASGQIEVSGITASLSASFATNAGTINNTSSNIFATTGSNTFNGSQTVQGNITVIGSLIAQQYVVSSSVSYFTSSNFDGSTKFGDSALDTHQFTGSVLAPNITGSLLGSSSYSTTSSVALTALTSSYINIATNAVSSSYAATSSYILNAVSSSFSNTSSLANTASYVLNSVSSSFASTASYNLNSVSSSYSLTSSYAANAGSSLVTGSTYPITSSWANNSISSSYATNAGTSNTANSANAATSASYALTASFAANAGSSLTTGSTYPITASWSISSSYVASTGNSISSSFATTASYVANTLSSSYSLTASYALNAGSGGGGSSSSTSSLIGQTFVPTASVSQLSLTQSVSNNDQILVILDGLVQSRTGSYTVSGSTLTLTENADSGSNIDVRFLGGSSSGGSSVSSSYALTSSFSSTSAPRTAIYRYGTTSVVNPGSYTNTIIKYDTAVTDSTGWYDNTNGRFTPTVAGWYQVSAGARVYGGSSTIEGYLALFKNGTQIAAIGGQGFVSGLIPLLIYFNGSTDYIQLYSNTSAAITNAQNSGTTPFTMVYMTS